MGLLLLFLFLFFFRLKFGIKGRRGGTSSNLRFSVFVLYLERDLVIVF